MMRFLKATVTVVILVASIAIIISLLKAITGDSEADIINILTLVIVFTLATKRN